ncbi:MAG: DUF4340 domain-containing protein [Gammaproteobacteria bacterium]|nr:DUF4340 domain-containing protein [Gammaproteobacteria bacterium]
MRNSKNIIILAVVTILFILAALFNRQSSHEITGSGNKVFPELFSRINDVSHINLQQKEDTTTLIKENEVWLVKQSDNYPAAVNKVRELLMGVAHLVRVEPKTQKPENYAKLGVQDVNADDSTSKQITIIAGKDEYLADMIIGNEKPARGDTTKLEYYIRETNTPLTWLVEGTLPKQWEPKIWLDTDIISIERDRIQQVRVTHSDGEVTYIHRDNPETRDFTLDSLLENEKILAPYEVNNIATTFTTMRFESVVSEANTTLSSQQPAFTAVLTSFDGLEITMQSYKEGDNYLSRYSARYNEPHAKRYKEALDTLATENESATPTDDAHQNMPKTNLQLKDALAVNAEVENYNKRWKGWLYQLPNFRNVNISKRKVDLLNRNKEKEEILRSH